MFANNFAKMTLEFPNPKIQKIVKDVKFTFPDMLGTVGKYQVVQVNKLNGKCITINIHSGGTIGLFSGLSIISVIEIIYWIYKIMKHYLCPEIRMATSGSKTEHLQSKSAKGGGGENDRGMKGEIGRKEREGRGGWE